MTDADLNLVVALPAEAKALNRILGLKRLQPDAEFPLYTGAGVALVLCGPGRQAARKAVAFLRQLNHNQRAAWLNIGIAGHRELSLGEPLLASLISSDHETKQWRLFPPREALCISGELVSVEEPCQDYRHNAACDMEAAGFVESALEFTDPERVQVLKVISDNRYHPAGEINGKMVKSLIEAQSTLIHKLVKWLSDSNG